MDAELILEPSQVPRYLMTVSHQLKSEASIQLSSEYKLLSYVSLPITQSVHFIN